MLTFLFALLSVVHGVEDPDWDCKQGVAQYARTNHGSGKTESWCQDQATFGYVYYAGSNHCYVYNNVFPSVFNTDGNSDWHTCRRKPSEGPDWDCMHGVAQYARTDKGNGKTESWCQEQTTFGYVYYWGSNHCFVYNNAFPSVWNTDGNTDWFTCTRKPICSVTDGSGASEEYPCSCGAYDCTNDQFCTGGVCGADPCDGVDCSASSVCYTDGTCTNGACSTPFATSGTSCDDSDVATESDVCDGAGNCAGTRIDMCVDDLTWVDNAYGDGLSSCTHMANNPTWCADYGDYSTEAQRGCPVSCNMCVPVEPCTGMGSTTKKKFQRHLAKLSSFLDFDGGSNGKERRWNKEKLMTLLGYLAFAGEPVTDNQFRTDAKKWFVDAYIEKDSTCQDSTYSEEKFDRLKTDVDTFVEALPDCVYEEIFIN